MGWAVAITAPDQLTAEMWRELLLGAGIPARIRSGDITTFLGVSGYPCRVLVPKERMEEAMSILPPQGPDGTEG